LAVRAGSTKYGLRLFRLLDVIDARAEPPHPSTFEPTFSIYVRPSRQPPEPYGAELALAANANGYESDREIQGRTRDDKRQVIVIDAINSDIDNELRTISREGSNLGREELVTDFRNHAFPVFSDSNSRDGRPRNRFG
jgi:hypothetical protein